MSRGGNVTVLLGGVEREFRLGIGEWRKVQEALDCGPSELLARMAPPFRAKEAGVSDADLVRAGLLGSWRVDDIRVPLHYGLVGAGSTPEQATKIIREHVDERPLLEPLPVAYAVIYASVVGASDERASGEPAGETEAGQPASPEASSASASTASTPPAARSGSRRKRSTA